MAIDVADAGRGPGDAHDFVAVGPGGDGAGEAYVVAVGFDVDVAGVGDGAAAEGGDEVIGSTVGVAFGGDVDFIDDFASAGEILNRALGGLAFEWVFHLAVEVNAALFDADLDVPGGDVGGPIENAGGAGGEILVGDDRLRREIDVEFVDDSADTGDAEGNPFGDEEHGVGGDGSGNRGDAGGDGGFDRRMVEAGLIGEFGVNVAGKFGIVHILPPFCL